MRTDSLEFIEWFRDSKVVDSNGRPRIVFHGTTLAYNHRASFGEFRTPAYFANCRESEFSGLGAAEYAGEDGIVIPVYLSIKNPVVFDLPHDFGELAFDAPWVEEVKTLGHDGMRYQDPDGDDLWVAFDRHQIKII